MSTPSRLASALLLTSALIVPSLAHAQNNPAPPATPPPSGESVGEPAPDQPPAQQQEDIDISVPGGGNEIVVTGLRESRNIAKSSDQVISVLSSAEIARTGEGNIAGALSRVTGLSVVGSGFVYVRGLGDRYSLALLNGSPLPSPEPLRRVVPLDIFPSGVIASSLVQKSYSVNYPGEFGGGVINLTTIATPRDAFLTIGGGLSGDSETTGQFGYSYYGSKSDWTGFDNGSRDYAPGLKAFFASGERISSGNVDTATLAGQLVNRRNGVVQRWPNLPPNASLAASAGKSFELGGVTLGVIASAGYSSRFQNRDTLQQTSLSGDLSSLETNFRRVTTDQRIVVNGLLGFGLEFGDSKVRWTNLYIRDTIKEARLGLGQNVGLSPTVDLLQQDTAWYERQLIDTQVVGEFKFTPELEVDVRVGYANSQREAPYEASFEYSRSNVAADPYGQLFLNRLNNGNQGDASISFSDLNENLYSGGLDVTYKLTPSYSVTVGGAYSNTIRRSSRRDFQFLAPSTLPNGIAALRPDLLLLPDVIKTFGIGLIESNEGNPAFRAQLENWAGYAKLNAQFTDQLSLDAGVRYEKAQQNVDPIQVFNTPGASTAGTALDRDYWLPAATLTWQFRPDMQVRVSGSKTIARPQFRELIYQPYFDPESNRQFIGNPLLVDSQLYNAEARYEWYFASDQRVSVAGFYKKLKKPIEAFVTQLGGFYTTTYANAPEADLYGGEFEFQKYVGLDKLGWDWLTDRRVLFIANYTYTQSKLKVAAGDTTQVFGASSSLATDYFTDGSPLTGQSDHIANIQLGLENSARLSQQTFLLTYASKRVISRGLNGSIRQPDVVENPGFRLDFIAREGVDVMGKQVELKLEGRNLTGRRHEEFQQSGSNRIDVNTYDVGRYFGLSASLKL